MSELCSNMCIQFVFTICFSGDRREEDLLLTMTMRWCWGRHLQETEEQWAHCDSWCWNQIQRKIIFVFLKSICQDMMNMNTLNNKKQHSVHLSD